MVKIKSIRTTERSGQFSIIQKTTEIFIKCIFLVYTKRCILLYPFHLIKKKMAHDVFDNTILCEKCNKKMEKVQLAKNGFLFRVVQCKNCGEKIIHPVDEENYNKFINLKNKEFNVKMRMVGNSYAVSIPKEIVSFMNARENTMKEFDNMVRLCFEEMGKVSLNFENLENKNARVIKSQEVRVVKNSKPVFHSKQFYDSANPKNNKSFLIKKTKEENDN